MMYIIAKKGSWTIYLTESPCSSFLMSNIVRQDPEVHKSVFNWFYLNEEMLHLIVKRKGSWTTSCTQGYVQYYGEHQERVPGGVHL